MSGVEMFVYALAVLTLSVSAAWLTSDYLRWNDKRQARLDRQEQREYDKARHPATLAQYGRGNLRVVGGRDD